MTELVQCVKLKQKQVGADGIRVTVEPAPGAVGTRRSDRRSHPTRRSDFAYTIRTHGHLVESPAVEPSSADLHPAIQMVHLVQSHDDMKRAASLGGAPDLLKDHLLQWSRQWRVALAKKQPLSDIIFMPDPKGWKKMLAHPRCEEFLQAVEVEINKLRSIGAGKVVPGGRKGVPLTEQILRSSFVFVTKRYADSGEIEKYKARLVADGSGQIDVDETHAPTVGGTTLRVLLAVAAQKNLHISKLDVESAFLIENVDVPTYVQLPREYTDYLGKPTEVWELIRSLYGLRQAPRLFWLGMRGALQGLGFVSSDHDPCLFIRREQDGTVTYVATHVDDCAVISASLATNRGVRDGLLQKYSGIKWEDTAETFVGLALTRRTDGSILVSQPAYTRHILDVMQVVKDGSTFSPIGNATLSKGIEGEVIDMTLAQWLRQAVGLVQFLTFTRLELVFALNLVAKNMHKPCERVKEAMMQILRYLANRPDDGLVYTGGGEIRLQCWCDASWQSEPGNGSRTGFAVCLGSQAAMIIAYSKLQSYATLSSQHAEIVAMTEAVRAVRHVRMLLEDMGFPQREPTPVWEDNVGCIAFANGTCPLEKTKHVENRDRYCREAVRQGIMLPCKIGTKINPVNGLTKEVSRDEQEQMRLFLQRGKLFAARASIYFGRGAART